MGINEGGEPAQRFEIALPDFGLVFRRRLLICGPQAVEILSELLGSLIEFC